MKRLSVLIIVIIVGVLILTSCETSSFRHDIIAGSNDDFMIVNHYVIEGTNYEIGQRIAIIAKEMNIKLSSANPLRNRIQLKYMEQNYPIHYERMRGVADVFRINAADCSVDISGISYSPVKTNCSAVFYPGSKTYNSHDMVSRNFDFTIGDLQFQKCTENELPALSRPNVFEIYPDEGFPSLYICSFELLGGVVDGINSEGLYVSNLDDGIYGEGLEPEPADSLEVGLHELLILRYLLDNCKDVDEAKEALLFLKQYYTFAPQHYLIADKNGNSFVFEFSRMRNQLNIIDGSAIQCVTNHLLSNSNEEDLSQESLARLRTLKSITKDQEKFSLDEIKEINSKVSPRIPNNHPVFAASRTLWHSIYDLDEQSLKIKFYLGETDSTGNEIILKYSDYVEFQLK